MDQKPRVGLVLGAGGVLGGAWMSGALHALAAETGWYPRHAEYLVGTSAGSVLAALGGAGVPPWLLLPDTSAGVYHGNIDSQGNLELLDDMWGRIVRRRRLNVPRPLPGSFPLAVAALRRRTPLGFMKVLGGLIPTGFMSTDPIKDTVRWLSPRGWIGHPNCWIVACDYLSGEREVFGRDGAPPATIAQAVAASCAIPGYYSPEKIEGRFYVDGGLHSMSNIDLLNGRALDLVIVFNPMSARIPAPNQWDPRGRFTEATRQACAGQVDAEVAALRAEGTQVLLFEPDERDMRAIGHNLMDETRRNRVMRTAVNTTTLTLQRGDIRHVLAPLVRRGSPAAAALHLPAPVSSVPDEAGRLTA